MASRLPNLLATPSHLYCEEFDESTSDLFSNESSVQFVQMPLGNRDAVRKVVTTPSDWDELTQIVDDQFVEHFCFINKRHSWSRMLITRELLLAILSYYAVFPSFLRVLRLFGARISEANPSGGFFYQSLSRSPSPPDTSLYSLRHGCDVYYTLRYVEKHGRSLSNPWSMRQMAVCHRANVDKQFSFWILVHAGQSLQERLFVRTDERLPDLRGPDGLEVRAVSAHLTILHFAVKNWATYMEYLSSEFKDRSDRALNCKVVNVKAREDDEFEICIQDMQWLQWLAQHLQIVKHNLLENSHTISGLGRYANSLKLGKRCGKDGNRHPGSAYGELSKWITAWKEETNSSLNSLHMLIHQVQECTRLVFNILKIKDDEIIQANGRITNVLTEQLQDHNNALLRLAYESESSVRSMKTITFLTLLYLPPSFLATLFGMNFFVVTSTGEKPQLRLLSDTWMYAATAIPLTVVTVAIWLFWNYREQIKFRKLHSSTIIG